MSKVEIDPVIRRRLQPSFSTRNGQLVSWKFQADLAGLANSIARFRTPQYFRSCGDVTAPVTSKTWRWSGHIGPMAGTMLARIYCAHASQVTQTHNPRVQMAIYDTSGNLLKSGFAYYGYSFGKTPDEIPQENGTVTIGLDVSDITGTQFRAQLIASDSARPISATVYEIAAAADTENGFCPQTYSVNQPILDTDRSTIQDLAHAIYRRGLGPVFCFSSDTDATAPSRAGAVVGYQNIIDGSAGTLRSPQSPGFLGSLEYCNRKTTTTVPVTIEAYASKPIGAAGDLRVVDLAGNTYAHWSPVGAAAWYTTTANLPADRRMYYVEAMGDGINPVITYAVSCYRRS